MAADLGGCRARLSEELRRSSSTFPALAGDPDAVEDLCEGAVRSGDIEVLRGVTGWLSWPKSS